MPFSETRKEHDNLKYPDVDFQSPTRWRPKVGQLVKFKMIVQTVLALLVGGIFRGLYSIICLVYLESPGE